MADNDGVWAPGRARNEQEAWLDIDYAIALSDLHCRLFRRIKKAMAFVSVLCGGGAVVFALSGASGTTTLLAAGVTLLAAIDLVFDPGHISARHHLDKREFLRLRRGKGKWDLPKIDAAYDKIRESTADCLKSLERPAHNENLRRHEFSDRQLPLTKWERVIYWIA